MIVTVCLPESEFQEYYMLATQSHDKPKAIRCKNHPSQTLIFTGFSESQNIVKYYRQDVRKYKALWIVIKMTIGHFYVKFLTRHFTQTL